ncbi:MAG: SNF2-related protein [Candidatus Pacearchaeota archaeon]
MVKEKSFIEILMEILAAQENSELGKLKKTAESLIKKGKSSSAIIKYVLRNLKAKVEKNIDKVPEELRQKSFDELNELSKKTEKGIYDKEYCNNIKYTILEKLIPLVEDKAKRTGELTEEQIRIKSLGDLANLLDTEPKIRYAVVNLAQGNEIDIADILSVVYEGKIKRNEVIRLLKKISLAQWLGNFERRRSLEEIVKDAETLLPLDKNEIIYGIIQKRIEGWVYKGLEKEKNQKKEIIKKIDEQLIKIENEKYGPEELKEEDRIKIKEKIKRILLHIKQDASKLLDLFEEGIEGIKSKIKNPLYDDSLDEKINGDEYLDFPSFYQVRSADFLLKKKRILIADEMGSGKTAQAIIGKIHLENSLKKPLKTVIVCSKDMKKIWLKRIGDYVENERIGRVLVINNYREENVAAIDNANWIIVSYGAFAFGNKAKNSVRKRLKEKLLNFLREGGYLIVDEVQNAKNPSEAAQLSKNIRDIARQSEFLCMLSGTPIPNTLKDTYVLISMLEPEKYNGPIDVAKAYCMKPELIRDFLYVHSLRRELKDLDIEPFKLPGIEQKTVWVELNKEQKRIFEALYENDELEGSQKLQLLKKALLDPRLLSIGKNGSLEDLLSKEEIKNLEKISPAKYEALDRIIAAAVEKGEKVVIFTPMFREEVTEVLEKRYSKYGCLRLDGTNRKDREEIRKKFQTNLENKVLIATQVAGEGISLTSASIAVFIDDPYAPGQREQMIARLYRPGQKKKVTVYNLAVKGTVDEGIIEFLKEKDKAIEFILKGLPLSKKQKILLSDLCTIERILERTPIGKRLYTPAQIVLKYCSRMTNLGSEKIIKGFEKSHDAIAREFAKHYPKLLEDRAPANAANLYTQIIKHIERTRGKLERKIDLGSGPGVLCRWLDEQVVSVDINKYHFVQPYNKNKTNIVAPIHKLPVRSGFFDLAVCSLVLEQTSAKLNAEGMSEREMALREANRILKDNGYYIIVLPASSLYNNGGTDNSFEGKWKSGLRKLGFRIIPELTGYANSEDNNFKIYIVTMQKVGKPIEKALGNTWALVTDKYNKDRHKIYSQKRKGTYQKFYIGGKPLDECLKEAFEKKCQKI